MISEMKSNEIRQVARLALQLFNESAEEELVDEFSKLLHNENAKIFLCYDEATLIGFAHCQLRYDYVEGTFSSPVGYLEGIYISEEYRRRGYAKQLVDKCCEWARRMGCEEFASDCEVENVQSALFHKAMDFNEINRLICFTKKL